MAAKKQAVDTSKIEQAKWLADELWDDLVSGVREHATKYSLDPCHLPVGPYDMKVMATHNHIMEMISEGYDDEDLAMSEELQRAAIWAFIEYTCAVTDLFWKGHVEDSHIRRLSKRCEASFAVLGAAIAELLPDLNPIDIPMMLKARDKIRANIPHGNEMK